MAAIRTIEARAIISAQDKTGGVFSKLARQIADFARNASRAQTIAMRSAAVSDTQGRARTAGISARNASRIDNLGTRAAAVRSASSGRDGGGSGRSGRSRGGLIGAVEDAGGHVGAYLAGGAVGLGAFEVGRRAFAAQVRQQHELVRATSAGLNPHEIDEMSSEAFDLSRNNPSASATDVMHMLRNARTVVGSLEEAQKIADPLLKLRTVALGANPGNAEALAEDLDKLVKAMELKGVTQDMPRFTRYMDGMAKALNTFGDTIRPTEYYEAFKYGRQSTRNLSEEYINSVAPTLMQELGGASAGVAHAAFYRAIVGGKMSNLATNELGRIGLLDESKVVRTKTGAVKGVGPGGIKGSQLAAENPYQWVQQYLLPALKAKGITDDHEIQERIARVFSNQVAAQLVSLFATQQPRIEKDAGMTKGAGGLYSAGDIQKRDFGTAWTALKAQSENLATAIKGVQPVVDAVNGLAAGLGDLSALIRGRPSQIQSTFNRLANKLLFDIDSDAPRSKALQQAEGPWSARQAKKMRDAADDKKAALDKESEEQQEHIRRLDGVDAAGGPGAIFGRGTRDKERTKARARIAQIEAEKKAIDDSFTQISDLNTALGIIEEKRRNSDPSRAGINKPGDPATGMKHWEGRYGFGFAANGTRGQYENTGEGGREVNDKPLPPARPAEFTHAPPPNYTLNDILGGGKVEATLNGSAAVTGEATITVRVEAGSALLQAVADAKAAAALSGRLITNGPGSRGVSSPDAAAGNPGSQ